MTIDTLNNGFDASIIDDIDQSTVEKSDVQFPVIQWHRGDPKMKKVGGMDWRGGWFVAENMAPADLTQYGWEKTSWTHGESNDVDGYYKPSLTMAIIRERKRWEVRVNNRTLNYAWKDYDAAKAEGRPVGRNHVLVLIQGMEDLGPFCLTLKGMAAVFFYGSRTERGAVTEFDATVIRAANEAVKKSGKRGMMPRRAFWLTVGPSQDKSGNPDFRKVGTGDNTSLMAVPMAYGLPEKYDQVDVAKYFVGREVLNRASDIYKDADGWATDWDNIAPGSSPNKDEANGGNGNGGRVQPVNEHDLDEIAAAAGV